MLRGRAYYTVATFMGIIVILTILFCIIAIHRLLHKSRRTENRFIKPDQILLIGLCVSNILLGMTGIFYCSFMFLNIVPPKHLIYCANYFLRFSMLSSLLHIIALTVERLLFVRFPFLQTSIGSKRTLACEAVILILSFTISSLPFTALLKVLYPMILTCDVILIITYLYIIKRIILLTRRRARGKTLCQHANNEARSNSTEWKATIVCLLVVTSFITFTTPPLIWTIRHQNKFQGRFYIQQKLQDYIAITIFICKALCDPLVYICRKNIARRLKCERIRRKTPLSLHEANLKT